MANHTITAFGSGPNPWTLSQTEAARQAIASLRGYIYQLHASVSAWIRLPHDGELYLEVAEDYAELLASPSDAEQILHAVQVKNTRESGSVTLNSPDVLKAIEALYSLQESNPGRPVFMTFLTTSPIGNELKAPLPSGAPALEVWPIAAKGGDATELRDALRARVTDGNLGEFLKHCSVEELRSRLLSRLTFACGAPSSEQLEEDGRNHLVRIRKEVDAEVNAARKAYDALFGTLYRTVLNPQSRRLDRHAFLNSFAQATAYSLPSQVVADLTGGWARERQKTEFDVTRLPKQVFFVPLIRLCRTIKWTTEITSISQVDSKPEHVLSSFVVTIVLSIFGVLALLLAMYSIGYSALNTNWFIGRYVGSVDILNVLAYQLKHIFVRALHGRLTAEGCTFFACVSTSLLITWGCAIVTGTQINSIASPKARREFSGYVATTALSKFNIVSWFAALTLFGLTFVLPSRWLQNNDAWIMVGIVDACLLLPWLWTNFTMWRRRSTHPKDDTKTVNKLAISLFVPFGLVLPVTLLGNYISAQFPPKIEAFMQSSCSRSGEKCTLSFRGKNLPSSVVVDELTFMLSATLMDDKGRPVSTPFGVSASLQVRKPLQSDIPVEISENDFNYGVVAERNLICPFDSAPPHGQKLLITSKNARAFSQVTGAPSLDDRMTIPIEFNMPVGNLFRGSSEKCPIYP